MTLILLALALIGVLLGWDWVVKRRRIDRRSEMKPEKFLTMCRGNLKTSEDEIILKLRRHIARELGLPDLKVKPDDNLTELRDRYCLVVSGHLALGDLFDDLKSTGWGTPHAREAIPETVQEYIATSLKNSSDASSKQK